MTDSGPYNLLPDSGGDPPPRPTRASERERRRLREQPLIPEEHYVVLCEEIAPTSSMSKFNDENFAARFSSITRPLRLAGRDALREDAEGAFVLIARLHAAMPWMAKAIDQIALQLRIQRWAGRPWLHVSPICLVGPPGAGKSHLARLIGDLSGIGHAALDLGGTSDNRALEGTARGYSQAQPAWPIMMIDTMRIANPLLVIEEIDKAGGNHQHGRPLDTLLAMLEPVSAARYHDKCLLADVDLTHVNWLLTCNSAENLPAPLRSRVHMITVDPPGVEHFEIIERAIRTSLARRWEVPLHDLPDLPPTAVNVLRQAFARHRSVRTLQRHIEVMIGALIPARRSVTH